MKRIGTGKPADGKIARSADQRAIDDEGSAADADQGAANADQTASDADQTAAERDEADSASDQLAAERDQASAGGQPPGDAGGAALSANEASRTAREVSKIGRLATHVARTRTTRSRVEAAPERDATAAARDETARQMDVRAEALDRSIAASDAPMADELEHVRARAAADRDRAAQDRADAADDRDRAAQDRADAAADRDRAAQDRADAAAERARLEAEVHSAHLDDLTGALRRESGRLALRHEIDRALRADGRFVIAFVDVDGMKRVNDRDGHAAGDHVLKRLVWTMRSNMRSFDPVVRYGGDEFVCGLGGVDLDEVERRFDLIDRSIRDDVGVGISIGLAGLEADDTLDRLTARADAALLDAKNRRGE